MVRAKFKVTHKTSHMGNVPDRDGKYVEKEVGTVKMTPVYGNGEANKSWAVWTPAGTIELTVNNPSAYETFKLGEEYFVDFTKAAE